MSRPPRIARVQILWSENASVVARPYPSLATADAALAQAFARTPPPAGGAYDKTAFEVVWVDGRRHEGRADVRDVDVRSAPDNGGILRQHLAAVARWLRDQSRTAGWWTPDEQAEHAAWGVELRQRLDAEPPLGAARNLAVVPEDQLLPLGTSADDLALSLLPEPAAAVGELEARFAAIRPPVAVWMGHGRTVPRATNRDVRYATNWISLALAQDIPRLRQLTGRPHGPIWDRWRKTVAHVGRHLGADPDAAYRDNPAFWSDQLPHLAHKIQAALATGPARNGNVAGGERVQWQIRYRGPRGGEYLTHHLAADYLSALQIAARSLGFWPEVQSVHWLASDGWRAA